VALIVTASTITANIANFDGRPELSRVLLFGLSGGKRSRTPGADDSKKDAIIVTKYRSA
jgi:hypothetical protein